MTSETFLLCSMNNAVEPFVNTEWTSKEYFHKFVYFLNDG